VRAAAAQRAELRHPAPNQVPLHAGQHHLTIVQRQAEWIEGRMRVGATATGNLVGLLRSIGRPSVRSSPAIPCPPPVFHAPTLAPPCFGRSLSHSWAFHPRKSPHLLDGLGIHR